MPQNEAVQALLAAAGSQRACFNLDSRYAADWTAAAFHALVNHPPLFAERRAVVVRGVEQFGKRKSKLRDEVVRYLADPNPPPC